MISPLTIIAFLVSVAIYLVLATALMKAAQPLRLRMADLGEQLLVDPTVPVEFKRMVRFCLDHAFNMFFLLLTGIILIPALSLIYVVRARWLTPLELDESKLSAQNRELFREVFSLHRKITLANYPILMTILSLEMGLFMGVAIILRSFVKGRMPTAPNEEYLFLQVVEGKSSMLWERFHNYQRAA